MSQPLKKQHIDPHEEPSLKGSFAGVMTIGVFIIVLWAAIFALFLVRQ